jgi:hypothetical protein
MSWRIGRAWADRMEVRRRWREVYDGVKTDRVMPRDLYELGLMLRGEKVLDLGAMGLYPIIKGGSPGFGDNLPAELPDPTGTTYYVDPVGGSDTGGNGSTSSPWRTLQQAVNVGFSTTPSNKRIRLRTGDYGTSGVTTHSVSGKNATATQPWLIEADTGHSPRIRGQLNFDNSSYGKMKNVAVRGVPPTGVTNTLTRFYNGSHDLQFVDVELSHSGDHNALIYVASAHSSANFLLLRCNIHDGGDLASGGSGPRNSTTLQGIYWPNGSGWVIDCLLENNGHTGLQWYSSGAIANDNDFHYTTGCLARNNRDGFHFNSVGPAAEAWLYSSISTDNNYGVSTGLADPGPSGQTVEVRNNLIFGNDVANENYGDTVPTRSGNLFVNPLFDTDGYHLTATSPARDSGAFPEWMWPTDRDGVLRSEPPDMGPYSFGGPVTPPPGSGGHFVRKSRKP